MNNTFSVTSLNEYVRDRLASDPVLMGLRVKGEISNFRRQPSGHVYFSLKDERSAIRCVMFAGYARGLGFAPKDGDEVIVYGSVGVYTVRGEYQVYAQAIEPVGKGSQLLELEALKRKLAAEGLFDESRKRPIDRFPKAVGIISAKGSAAMADITTNLRRRYPLCEIRQYPSLVQGEGAPADLRRALSLAMRDRLTTIIIGRGGGASEDLSAFNDEALVRLAASSPIPIIAAVGHEIDFTLIDYVADKRVSTPTGAAEAAAVDIKDIIEEIALSSDRLDAALRKELLALRHRIDLLKNRSFFTNPESIYLALKEKLAGYAGRLSLAAHNRLLIKKAAAEGLYGRLSASLSNRLSLMKAAVDSLGKRLAASAPENVISRGYALISDERGKLITSTEDAALGETVRATLKDGILTSTVTKKEKRHG